MTTEPKTRRIRYRSHSGITTQRLVFTGFDLDSFAGPLRTHIIDFSDLDTHEAHTVARTLSDWCDRVLQECAAEWAAEAQLDLFEGA